MEFNFRWRETQWYFAVNNIFGVCFALLSHFKVWDGQGGTGINRMEEGKLWGNCLWDEVRVIGNLIPTISF